MPKKSLIQNRTWYVFSRPSEVPEETVGEADLEVRPGTIPHGYEVNFKWLYKLDANFSRFDKRKERVVSATLSTCSLDLLGIFCCLLLCVFMLVFLSSCFIVYCCMVGVFFLLFHCLISLTLIKTWLRNSRYTAKDRNGRVYYYEENGNESCWSLPNVGLSIQVREVLAVFVPVHSINHSSRITQLLPVQSLTRPSRYKSQNLINTQSSISHNNHVVALIWILADLTPFLSGGCCYSPCPRSGKTAGDWIFLF